MSDYRELLHLDRPRPSKPDPKKPHLIIMDGDVLAFRAAAAVQKVLMDDYGNVQPWAELKEGIVVCDGFIQKYRGGFCSENPSEDVFIIVVSDHEANWRFDVSRDYKSNRKETITPMLLGPLKAHLAANYGAAASSRLEADDTIALLMTDDNAYPGYEKIAVGRDKDFFSIPGWHYQIPNNEKQSDVDAGPFYITLEEADRWHAIQTLGGDMTDGFPGCPGIGYKRASQILDEGMTLVAGERKVTRGHDKGKTVTSWNRVPAASTWDIIVGQYLKAGLGESEALDTARLSRLLRAGEYHQGEVKLWNPRDFPTSFKPRTNDV